MSRQPIPEHGAAAIFRSIQAAHPQRTRAWRLEVPQGDNRAWTARYYSAQETRDRTFAPLQVTVDPYSLQVTESRLWWPSRQALGHALSVKRRASSQRRIYDLHKVGGMYGLILLAILAVTGVMLAKPSWFEPALRRLSSQQLPPILQPSVVGQPIRIDSDQAAAIARRTFPQASVRWIETPDTGAAVYRVRLHQPGEPSQRFPQTFVWVDAVTGQVLASRDAYERSAGDAILAWLHPLHNGEAFGLTGRWLAFLAGFLPLLLFATGWMRWRTKVQASHPRDSHKSPHQT